jgi:DNA modification methylase
MIAIAQPDNCIDTVLHGDALARLKSLPDNSVDAIVTDPPAGISFMGKEWDNFTGKQKTYDSAAERAKANANKEKLKQYQQGATPFGFSSSSGQPTKQERDAFIAFLTSVMSEALRCLRPGGHALVWALPRTSHWTALALEDAGFEVRDAIFHHFGSGFPKSTAIDKQIDKLLGAEREVIGNNPNRVGRKPEGYHDGWSRPWQEDSESMAHKITKPATPEAQQWAGYGTALKPSTEIWWLVRKPLSEPSIAANVLKWGVGGLNIDGSRIAGHWTSWTRKDGTISPKQGHSSPLPMNRAGDKAEQVERNPEHPQGRWPANLLLSHSIWCVPNGTKRVRGNNSHLDDQLKHNGNGTRLFGQDKPHVTTHGYADSDGLEEVEDWQCTDDCPIRLLNEQSGIRKSGGPGVHKAGKQGYHGNVRDFYTEGHASEGGASRYFTNFPPADFVPFCYTSKASRAERNAGCEGLPITDKEPHNLIASKWIIDPRHPDGGYAMNPSPPLQNSHPTVKPLALMRWLVRLITPPDGIVLDPFLGSGSTAVAAIQEGFHFIGIEQKDTEDEPYCQIAEARIAHAWRGEP